MSFLAYKFGGRIVSTQCAARAAELPSGFTNLYRSVTNLYAHAVADVFTYLQLSDEQGKHRAASLSPGESECHSRALAWSF
jgi:hypothetical protein